MKTQEIELKEGMTARVEGCKVVIETPEWKPTDGEFVTQNTNWVSIYAGPGHTVDTMSDYCGTWINVGNFTDTKPSHIRRTVELRKSTPAEIQAFHSLLEKAGKKWNPDAKKVEDLEWKPKAGDVVTTVSPRGKTISIYKSGNVSVGCVWDFYASMHYFNGFRVEEQMMDCFGDGKIRLSTYDERCTFFARLVAEGYKWNAKKLKLTRVGKWVPKDGEFVYYAENDKTNEAVSIYKGVDCSYASILVRSGSLESFTAPVAFLKPSRAATESERQKLLDALAKEGKRWNAAAKRIERWRAEPGGSYEYVNS